VAPRKSTLETDPFGVPKALFGGAGNALQGVADFLNRVQGRPIGRAAAAEPVSTPQRQGPTRDIYEQPGVGYFDRGSGRFLGGAPSAPPLPPSGGGGAAPGQGTTPIVQSSDDQYRQLLSQYGALTKAGEQEKAEQLGMEIWNKKYGKTAMAQPGGAVGARNPLIEKMFGYQAGASETNPSYAGSKIGSEDFAMAANAVPAPWNQQGVKVSSDFSGVVPFQAAKTTGEGMPAFQTTGEKAEEFLRNVKLGSLF
jgi:hypothetical protein